MTATTILRSVLLLATVLCVSAVHAQTTYRWVDKKSGRTIYSDQPPPPGVNATMHGKSTAANEPQLPYATRQAAEKYPVTLYTAASCTEICKDARNLLNGRGVPFTEKISHNAQEAAEAGKLFGGGEMMFPSISIGTQNLSGLDPTAWNNMLDLAGYPATAPYGSKPAGVLTK